MGAGARTKNFQSPGKAIKNLGEFLITTVGEIRMYNRLRVIGAEMRNFEADLPVSHFRDILELQRCGCRRVFRIIDARGN